MPDARAVPALRGIWGYPLSVLLVALSTGVTLLLRDYAFRTPLFLPAILLSTWFGGTGPGLLAVLLSTLSINFFLLEPLFAFSFTFRDAVHLAVFLFSALLISSWSAARRRAEHALIGARDQLEARVKERTADLSRSNERFRNLVNTVGGIVWEADAETFRFTFVGEQAERILGYPIQDWVSKPTFWKDHLHPADQEWAVSFCVKATAEKKDHDFEYRMIAEDGRIVWLRDLVTVVVEGDRVTKLRGVMIDITNQKRAEEALREQANLLDLTHDTVFVRDMNNVITYWNRGADERYGWSSTEAVGRVSHELMQTSFPNSLEEINAELLEAGRWEGELVHIRRDRTPVLVASRWALQRDELGSPIAILETNNDITERKQAEEELRRSEAFLAQGQRISHTGSWSWEVSSGRVTWSDEHFRIFGFDVETTEPSFQLFLETVHPEDRSFIERSLDTAVREKSAFDLEFRIVSADGSTKHVQGVGRPVLGASGEVDRYIGTTVDISERKRGEALFAGEKRLLEMIATGVALEEILNVLCTIIEEYRRGMLASILLLRSDGLHLDSVAGPSLPRGWREEMEKLPIGPCAGSCGTAAYRGSAVIVSDIATDPLWEVPEHRAAALGHGLRASWSNPILSSKGDVLGTFCIYGREIGSPSTQDRGLIEKATHLARIAIERDRAEVALRTSEEKYRDLIDASPDAICVVDADARFILANPAGVSLAGRSEDELIGSPIAETYLAEERHLLMDRLEKLKAEGSFRFERKFLRANGEVVPVEVSLSALRGQHYQAIIRDISQRKRREALMAAENRVLAMVAKGDSLGEILDNLCLLVEGQSPGVVASILLMDPNGKQLRHGAAPNLPRAYSETVDGLTIGPAAGSCGTAAYLVKQVIVSDIAVDPLWDPFRDIALAHSLRACWSTPILSSEDKVIGTFAMYYHEPRSPSLVEQDTIKHMTHLAGIAIQRRRSEEALRASEQVARGQVEALAQSLDVLATAPEPEKFIGQMLSTIGRLLDAQSVSLWLFDEATGSPALRSMVEGGRLVAPDPDHPFMKDPDLLKQNAVINELLFTGSPVICEDLQTDQRVPGVWREYLKRKGAKTFLGVPILVGGQVRGFIGVRHTDRPPYRPEEIELTQALAHQVMLALQLNEFAEQGQRAAVFEERNRMARDIHDTLAQGFTGVIVQLEAAEDAIACGCRKEADKHLHRAGELARQSLNEARRSVHALRPQALQEHNFWDALKGIIKNTTAGTALHTTFQAQGRPPELPQPWQENLLHIGQEALTNTLKYAHARNFETRLTYKAKRLRLELRDDGNGFRASDRHDGVGLTGMRERVEQMGGELEITSARGKGTKITVLLPCNGESVS